jgi:cytochrome c oxidase subunit II
MWGNLPFLPDRASTLAGEVDTLFLTLVAITAFFSSLIFLLILYFSIRYRRRPGRSHAAPAENNIFLELFWTGVPICITFLLFMWGASLFMRARQPPSNAMSIYIVGKQWMWKVQHPEGRREIGELHIPVGRPVKLVMASQDVIHDFFIPAFRIKQDVVPGRYTAMWFEATKVGEYHLFCSQYCGTQHSGMGGKVVVMEPRDFEEWLAGGPSESPVKAGERLFSTFDCISCHMAGPRQRGPSLGGAFGKPVRLQGGQTVLFDDTYVRESIVNPAVRVVEGYSPIMPTFQGQLTEEQIMELIAYIRSLTPEESARQQR